MIIDTSTREDHAPRGRFTVGKGHRLEPLGKRCPWRWCPRCGLVVLRNEATRKALRKQCDAEE